MKSTLLIALAAMLLACGTEVTDSASSAGGTAAQGGSAGTTSQGGNGGDGGTPTGGGGGAINCPDISCGNTCPGALWDDLAGCPSCACASDLEMVISGTSRPVQNVTFQVTATQFIGGIDRWVFDFLFQYDDPMVSDDAEDVTAHVSIMRLDPMFEPDENRVTYDYPDDNGNPLELVDGEYTLYGFAVLMEPLYPASGYFSIRRVGSNFEGHVSLDYMPVGNGIVTSVHVASPFTVGVPSSM